MFAILLVTLHSLIHPFHVSVSDIKYKEDQKAIQVSTRIFLDDLEIALRRYSGNAKLNITEEDEWDMINDHLRGYVMENLKLSDEKGVMSGTYIGAEIEDDVMWVYIEIEKVRKLKTIKVWNSLLFEVFGDQENLVHFRAFDKVKSERLYKGEGERVFSWE